MNNNNKSWIKWQLIDATFPTGGFAHSFGLEAAVQENKVRNKDELMQFIDSTLHQCIHLFLPLVNAGSRVKTIEEWHQLDQYTNAILTNHVSNRASIALGLAFLRTANFTFNLKILEPKLKFGHHAPLFGYICTLLDCSGEESQRMFAYSTIRDVLSAATRLNLIGPMESSRLLFVLSCGIETKIQHAGFDRSVQDIYQTDPVLDIVQGMQDQLYTRIFNT